MFGWTSCNYSARNSRSLNIGSFVEEDMGRQGMVVSSVIGNTTVSRRLEIAAANLQEYCNDQLIFVEPHFLLLKKLEINISSIPPYGEDQYITEAHIRVNETIFSILNLVGIGDFKGRIILYD